MKKRFSLLASSLLKVWTLNSYGLQSTKLRHLFNISHRYCTCPNQLLFENQTLSPAAIVLNTLGGIHREANMKLLADSNSSPDTLLCLTVASVLDIPVTWTKTSGVIEPVLVVDEPGLSSVTSSYAVTTYLLSRASPTNSSRPLVVPKDQEWVQDDVIFWVISRLLPALRGVNKEMIDDVLDKLENQFFKDSAVYCLGDSLSLADLFIWTSLRASRIYPVLREMTGSRPRTHRHTQLVEADARVQKALQDHYDGAFSAPYSIPCSPQAPQKRFYITTAINYTNGPPHIGHAYEAVLTDVLARFHRIAGREVLFMTGTDEHGQKIATTAEKQGKKPIDICDYYAKEFQALDKTLDVSYDTFIRTPSPEHKATAQMVWRRSRDQGDIYLGTYVGWYNVREEAFVPETEAKMSDYKDPMSGVPLQKMEEVSYFFKMSKYQQKLVDYIHANPEFIQPSHRRTEILTRLKEPLEDLSCSRTTFSWGVPVPDDPVHVMYVWFDALVSYMTGSTFGTGSFESNRFWPANVHIIGKDIAWFHCVIWPCMLMSIGVDLPKTVFSHGFILAKDGHKMSKSLNNVVDPVLLLQSESNSDTFRFYMMFVGELGRDLRFDVDAMYTVHDSELADTVGNMVHRATGLCAKFCEGRVPDCGVPSGSPPFDFEVLRYRVDALVKNFLLNEALNVIMGACRDTNKYLTEKAPWAITDSLERQRICRLFLEAVYYLAHFLMPFIPNTGSEIFRRLGTSPGSLRSLSGWYDNVKPGSPVLVGDVLFKKREGPAGL